MHAHADTVVTMTTIGYGDADLLPVSTAHKAYTMVFMLLGTTALALSVHQLQSIIASRRIYKRNFQLELTDVRACLAHHLLASACLQLTCRISRLAFARQASTHLRIRTYPRAPS